MYNQGMGKINKQYLSSVISFENNSNNFRLLDYLMGSSKYLNQIEICIYKQLKMHDFR